MMARRSRRPCGMQLAAVLAILVVAGAAAVVADDDEKCGNPCGNPCGVPCIYASPPPPPVYSPPPAPVYSPPPAPVYYPPPTPEKPGCPPPPEGGGGGYEPAPYTPGGGYNPAPYTPGGGGYNPTPSGWYTPPNQLPSYNTPPGTLYPQDPGFRPNGAPGRAAAAWRAVAFLAVAGAFAL